jgi:hypothetical protein
MRVKNISNGPRGVHVGGIIDSVPDGRGGFRDQLVGGHTVVLRPGEEQDLDVDTGTLKHAVRSDWFQIEGEATVQAQDDSEGAATVADAPDFDAMSDDDLRTFIEKRDGERPHHRTGRETLLRKARGEE